MWILIKAVCRIYNLVGCIFFCFLSNFAISEDESFSFFVVGSVESMSAKNIDFSKNIYPWQSSGDNSIGTNACGFIDVRYVVNANNSVSWNKNDYKTVNAKVLIGETCEFGELMFNKPTIIAIRYYKGNNYLVDHATLYGDDTDKYFVSQVKFIKNYKLTGLITKIKNNEKSCIDISVYSRYMKKTLLNKFYSEITEDNYLCMSKGVYLEHFMGN